MAVLGLSHPAQDVRLPGGQPPRDQLIDGCGDNLAAPRRQ